MRYQRMPYTCGPAAISNALKCFGHHYRESTVVKHCKTSVESGTDENRLMEGIRSLGWQATEMQFKNGKEAYRFLCQIVSHSPAIICVDKDQHWIAAIGRTGRRVIVVDSKNTEANYKENGTHVPSPAELIARWRSPENIYYGIIIHRRKIRKALLRQIPSP